MDIQTRRINRFLTALILANVCFIWGNSLMPATISGAFSDGVREILNQILGGLGRDVGLSGDGLLRKVAHATEFAALGLELTALFRAGLRQRIHLILLMGVSTALADETIQLFVAGRAGQIRDVWIDFGGFCAGVLLMALALKLFHRKK